MDKRHRQRIAAFAIAAVVGYSGTQVSALSQILTELNPTGSDSVAVFHGHDHSDEDLSGEHRTAVLIVGEERKNFPRSEAMNFQIRNNLPDPALTSYSVELVDEEGNELLLLPESPVTTILGNGSSGYQLSVPADLAEGLYSFRIKTVARIGEQFADSGIALDFAILDDAIYILTNEEWLELSVANGAVEK